MNASKNWIKGILAMASLGATVFSAAAADQATATNWHAQTLSQALINVIVFALVGVAIAVLGYKIFDKCTPGDLTKEIIENKNVAAAIIGGAVILGVCLIVAAAMVG